MNNKKKVYVALGIIGVIVVILIGWQLLSGKSAPIEPRGGEMQSAVGDSSTATDGSIPTYDFKDAPDHIGEKATIKGAVLKVFTSKSGVTFFDFCKAAANCPFSAVIFSGDLKAFGDVTRYQRDVAVTGVIKSYQNKAEIVLNDPGQIE